MKVVLFIILIFLFPANSYAQSPLPSPSPAQTPSPSPSTTPSPSPQPAFSITANQLEINSDEELETTISLKVPTSPNTAFYIKGAFRQAGSTNYFGQVLVDGFWVKNSSKYDLQQKITTDSTGSWQGNLIIKVDPNDSGYIGENQYLYKVGRYDSTGNNLTWSNELQVTIYATALPSPAPEVTPAPSPTTQPSITPTPTPNPSIVLLKPSPSIEIVDDEVVLPEDTDEVTASAAYLEEPEPSLQPILIGGTKEKSIWPIIIRVVGVFVFCIAFVYGLVLYYKRRYHSFDELHIQQSRTNTANRLRDRAAVYGKRWTNYIKRAVRSW